MRDFTELDKQIDNAEAHALDANAPGRNWNQRNWFAPCRTYGCIAGNTILDAGYNVVHNAAFSYGAMEETLLNPDGSMSLNYPSALAARLLGLNDDECDAIFAFGNTIGVLRRLQKDLHDGREIDYSTAVDYQEEEKVSGAR